jgi:hypothetical protein
VEIWWGSEEEEACRTCQRTCCRRGWEVVVVQEEGLCWEEQGWGSERAMRG